MNLSEPLIARAFFCCSARNGTPCGLALADSRWFGMLRWACIVSMVMLLSPNILLADQPTVPLGEEIKLPYGFYSEHFGLAAGYAHGIFGSPQPQASLLGTLIAGSNGSVMAFGLAKDLKTPFSERLFVDAIGQVGYFADSIAYINGKPAYVGQQAGSNDSAEGNFVQGDGLDAYVLLSFNYVLPIGEGRDEPMDIDRLVDGLPLEGEEDRNRVWNPLVSGRTYLELRPFYRTQEINADYLDAELRTNGIEFAVLYDNRDFERSPSQGSSIRARVSRDWGWGDSSREYTVYGVEADKYFSLGSSENFRQRVIALDFWTVDTPTWDDFDLVNGEPVYHRPPAYAGATLGGVFRMRGYPSSRFNDRAAVYYGVEGRFIPRWNPFNEWPWLNQHLGVQWWQVVAFGEIGRVAPEWDLSELHKDMKKDVGLGVRLMAKGMVVRIDAAVSEEDFGIQMMVGQPFQF